MSCRCTTGKSAVSTNTTPSTWRSWSWASLGTTATAWCPVCTPSASTPLTSECITAKERVLWAPPSSLRHQKQVRDWNAHPLFNCYPYADFKNVHVWCASKSANASGHVFSDGTGIFVTSMWHSWGWSDPSLCVQGASTPWFTSFEPQPSLGSLLVALLLLTPSMLNGLKAFDRDRAAEPLHPPFTWIHVDLHPAYWQLLTPAVGGFCREKLMELDTFETTKVGIQYKSSRDFPLFYLKQHWTHSRLEVLKPQANTDTSIKTQHLIAIMDNCLLEYVSGLNVMWMNLYDDFLSIAQTHIVTWFKAISNHSFQILFLNLFIFTVMRFHVLFFFAPQHLELRIPCQSSTQTWTP